MVAYVELDIKGRVTAIHGGPQPGNDAVTAISDQDPRVVAFLAASGATPPEENSDKLLSTAPPA